MGAPRGKRKKKHIKFNKELGRLIKDSRKVWGYIQYDLLEDFGSSQMIIDI